MKTEIGYALILLACLTPLTQGGTSQATIQIGGPGSCSSEGFDDPGLLSDGLTEASATLDLTLDTDANTLMVVVTNTSPVLVGVPNPLLTDVFFNTPLAVTGMSLASQFATAGPDTAWDMTFDADLASGPNPNGAAGFGSFGAGLNNPGGITGSIQNALADTVSNPGTHAISPVSFSFDLTGDLTGLTADDFAAEFSVIPPGNKPSHGVGKFQAGGVAESSAFISDATEECFLVIGDAFGSDTFLNPGPSPVQFETAVGGLMKAYGASLESFPTVPFEAPRVRHTGRGGLAGGALGQTPLKQLWVQVVMWNPETFPGNPNQWSNGLLVTIWPGGAVTSTAYGAANGMGLTHDQITGPDGKTYLQFPFSIDGL